MQAAMSKDADFMFLKYVCGCGWVGVGTSRTDVRAHNQPTPTHPHTHAYPKNMKSTTDVPSLHAVARPMGHASAKLFLSSV